MCASEALFLWRVQAVMSIARVTQLLQNPFPALLLSNALHSPLLFLHLFGRSAKKNPPLDYVHFVISCCRNHCVRYIIKQSHSLLQHVQWTQRHFWSGTRGIWGVKTALNLEGNIPELQSEAKFLVAQPGEPDWKNGYCHQIHKWISVFGFYRTENLTKKALCSKDLFTFTATLYSNNKMLLRKMKVLPNLLETFKYLSVS